MKVWITKYALTEGLIEAEVITSGADCVTVKWENGLNGVNYFHGNDWWGDERRAKLHALQMRDAKIISLRKQISKLETMEFP